MQEYGLKEIAEMFNISEQTIRFYDSKGLLPFIKRRNNNYRYITENSLSWVRIVIALRNAGMEIKNIQKYIELSMQGDKTLQERLEIIKDQKETLSNKIEKLNIELDILNHKEQHYKKVIETGIEDEWNPLNFKSQEKEIQDEK